MAEQKAGRYELLEELGRGAMGVVWKGFDPTIGRTVAVKTMKLTEEGSGLARPDLVMRFQTETRAAGLLTHPNIVVIYDAGEEGGLFYITMEYIQGQSLQALVDKKQAFPLPRIVKIMEQTCAALGYAHQHNVVHRDVKPANIMLTTEDTVKITDFGMAKILQLGTTQTGQIVGTPSYMSPEQVKGKPIDGRTDIFSLGIVLYELVTGEKPFPGQTVTTVIYKIVHEDPIPPLELDSSIHPGLSYVITKALEKEPDNRYQTCQQLMEDLRRFRDIGMPSMSQTVVVTGRGRPGESAAQVPPPPPKPAPAESPTLHGMPTVAIPAPQFPKPEVPGAAAPVAPPTPSPAPTIRSTTTLPPLPYVPPEAKPAKKPSYTWVGLVLVVVLAVGGYLLWPILGPLVGIAPPTPVPSQQQVATPETSPAAPEKQPEATPPAPAPEEATPTETRPAEPKPVAKAPEPKPEPVKPSADSLALQRRIEQRLARAGFAGKVRVQVDGTTVQLSGSLKPREYVRLRQQARSFPAGIKVEDQIEVLRPEGASEEERPRTAPGQGEIEVVTDVMGAQAVIKGPSGETRECKTPCRFEELPPGRYTMAVTHPGYRPINRILQVQPGHIKEERLTFQPYAAGISVITQPAQAEVFINGQRHPELTPTTIRIAPGSYTLRVQKAGYEAMEQSFRIEGDSLQQWNVPLQERPRGFGLVEVRTVPPGADILVNGTHTGRKTPFTIQLPAGRHTLTLYLKGYQAVQRVVEVQGGKSSTVNEVLPK